MRDAIYGFIIGDALGVPVEFSLRSHLKENPVTGMTGHGTWNQPKGTWSDDSGMVLATCESIKRKGKIDLMDIMVNFGKWFCHGEFMQNGECFDIGDTTYNAILNYIRGKSVYDCGGRNIRDNGNGSLMRILPLAFINCSDEQIMRVSALTHGHIISELACVIYVRLAQNLLKGNDLKHALNKAVGDKTLNNFARLANYDELVKLDERDIKSTGFVVDTLEAAVWCVANTNNYRDCVLKAVNLGGDTDTIAAVAGGLAGIIYGYDSIPKDWLDAIYKKEIIENCLF